MWDRATSATTRITKDGTSSDPAISSDGRFIAFVSAATDPISDDRIGQWEVLVWDRLAGTTTRVSDGVHAAKNPVISADGRYIAFDSMATTEDFPRDVFVWDRSTGTASRVTTEGGSRNPAISGDGHYVEFASATDPVSLYGNGLTDVFVVDRANGKTVQVSHAKRPAGLDVHPAISADGRRIAYERRNDVFVWDRKSRATTRIANGHADDYLSPSTPAMSANGRYVTWDSWQVFVPGDKNGFADVFVWDRKTDALSRITNGRWDSVRPTISADGQRIAYASGASDLIPHGSATSEEYPDVFVWDRRR
jgi:Tol biopolymer transport system component